MASASNDRELLQLAVAGDGTATDLLFARHRDRLRRCVSVRQDPRLRGRFDPSDVLQEALLEAAKRITTNPPPDAMPVFVWLRLLVIQKLMELTRKHLSAGKRSVGRLVSFDAASESFVLAHHVVDAATTPAHRAEKLELIESLKDLLTEMDHEDRQILILRHVEQLTNSESAEVLGINPSTASSRHIRALLRLRRRMESLNLTWGLE